MTEHPILFSAPMVRAILDGSKTQTRRMMKRNPCTCGTFHPEEAPNLTHEGWQVGGHSGNWMCGCCLDVPVPCPFGIPGDQLWVRETFCLEGTPEYPMSESKYPRDGRPVREATYDEGSDWLVPWYRATDGEPNIVSDDLMDEDDPERTRWKPSIFMPRWASRIQLEVVEVRVQRLQDISEVDAEAEGPPRSKDGRHWLSLKPGGFDYDASAKNAFRNLWDSINGKREGAAWADNPWTWAITFRSLKS